MIEQISDEMPKREKKLGGKKHTERQKASDKKLHFNHHKALD